ncbi:methyltransferase domain-containing protein [Aporhodopirellula aestuarii]|uniref:Methyltransferase domain-containing protein n=1 Tax=Aporhodopirellula aestuarii TaxID=2950107 RepID=A0ABT0U8C2_9BACT|nr:methyltransferase domain-containing protein [Aporhodopirellula aestuarii]MCM2373143.1 methyltransferase domain-containing protein [Aporhodopirellula aestuarii]
MSNQDRTLDHYQELMTINATSHILRAARQIGLFDQLAEGQKTVETLAENLKIPQPRVFMLIQSLIAVGIIEQYQEDYALSSTARLLCQYDADLGDSTWNGLADSLRRSPADPSADETTPNDSAITGQLQKRFDAIAATQWVHTPAAMQVAEILDLGSTPPDPIEVENNQASSAEPTREPIELLDFGCGSAVWSCAMAFREPAMRVTAIDNQAALAAATTTATSIGLSERFETRVGDVPGVTLPDATYDMIVIAQRLHAFPASLVRQMLDTTFASLKTGGRLIVIDSFRGPHQPMLAESLEALRMEIQTDKGEIPELPVAEQRMKDAGYENIQFTFIAASRTGLGMMIGTKS